MKEHMSDNERVLAAHTMRDCLRKGLPVPEWCEDAPLPRGPRRLCDKRKKDLNVEITQLLCEALETVDEENGSAEITWTTLTELAEAWLVLMRDRGAILEWHTWHAVEEEIDKGT